MGQPGIVANPDCRGQLKENLFFLCPSLRLRFWSRDTGSTAVPSRICWLILDTRLNFVPQVLYLVERYVIGLYQDVGAPNSLWVGRMSGMMRDGTTESDVSRNKFPGANGDIQSSVVPCSTQHKYDSQPCPPDAPWGLLLKNPGI